MILNDSKTIELKIGATMKIQHGSSMNSYITSSQSTAQEVLSDDESSPANDPPTTAREVVSDLTT